MQHRREQEEVLLVYQSDFYVLTGGETLFELDRRVQSGETTTNDNDSVLLAHV